MKQIVLKKFFVELETDIIQSYFTKSYLYEAVNRFM